MNRSLALNAHNNKRSHNEGQRERREIASRRLLGGESGRRRIDYLARLCANETASQHEA